VGWRSMKDAKGMTTWCVDTRDKVFTFEDPKTSSNDPASTAASAEEWLESLERAKEIAISQSLTNSYSGDDAFKDLPSGMSSPARTIGGDAKLEGAPVTSGRHTLTKSQGGMADAESAKGRKRFSKRQSKSGLAAVF